MVKERNKNQYHNVFFKKWKIAWIKTSVSEKWIKNKNLYFFMKATEKSCEGQKTCLKNEIDHVIIDTLSEQTPDFVMQKHDEHLKIKKAKTQNGQNRIGSENFSERGITVHAEKGQNDTSEKPHGNTYVMNFSKNKSIDSIVENIDEKIIAHQEIVKTLPEIESDIKNKKPTTLLFEKFKKKISVPPEFWITSLVSFGKHHPEILDEINMSEVVKTTYDGMIQLIEHLYFNDYRPQYQNVKMKNVREKHCEFYNGTMWKLIDESTLIHNIIVYTKDIIDNHFIKNKKKISAYYQERYNKFSNSFDEIIIKKMNGKVKNDQYEKIYGKVRIHLINKKENDRVIKQKKKLGITV